MDEQELTVIEGLLLWFCILFYAGCIVLGFAPGV